MATLIKSREFPCRLVRALMRNSIGNTVGIMLLCFEILIMSECSSPGELCSSCMHGRKRDFKLAVRGPSTRHLPSTRSHSTTFGLSLVPKSTTLHRTRTQTLPANVRCLQEPWRLVSGRRTMCGQLFLHPATRVSRLRTNPNSMTSESQPQDIWCQNDRTLRSWSRPEIHYPAQHEDTTLRLQIDLRIVNQ